MFTVSNAFSVDVVNSIYETESHSSLVVYPNPTDGSDFIRIEWPLDDVSIEASIYNSVGQCIDIIRLNGGQSRPTIKVNDYANGTYYLRLHSSNAELSIPFNVTH